ncbi:hypothetical protein SAMN04487977_1152 [Treponema bryantii]|uniref:Uncharacterized protein n=1 Tax=Treponema bryantii TaxID=163 RepID=A0A1H9JS73_9SPIR|nr:hypothetical protein [Treponema bryantii]SEQ89648.1 hypothetical protein SAMN04487977_1152 [Treponema bryantii]
MKNMKIKLLSVMISALLCSHLWAQGSESAGQWFTIKLEDEAKTTTQIKLTTENGMHMIKGGFRPSKEQSAGYTAFFVSDDGKYYIYEYDSKKNIKNDWTEADENYKTKLETIYSYVNNLNLQVLSDDCETYLTNVGYKEINKSDLNFNHYRNKNNGFDDMSIYNKTKGTFVLAIFPNSNNEKIKILSFKDTKSFADVYINDNDLLNKYFEWLEKSVSEKRIDSNLNIYKKISQLIYESLDTCTKRNNTKEKYKFFHLYDNDSNKPIRRYIQLAAKNDKNVFFNELLGEDANQYISITNAEGEKFAKLIKETKNYKKGFENLIKDKIIKANIWPKNQIFMNVNIHSVVLSDITEAREGDIVFFGKYAEKSNDSSEKILYDIDYAVVVDKVNCSEEYGANQSKSLGDLCVASISEDSTKNNVEKKKLSEFFPNGIIPEYVEVRRLLKKNNSSNIELNNTFAWNLLDTDIDPNSLCIEIGTMKESTQKSSEPYRWIPNTGDYLNLEKISLTANNLIGLPVHGNNWTITLSGAVDRGWSNDKNDNKLYGNIYNNSECEFEVMIEGLPNKMYLKKVSENSNKYEISGDIVELYVIGNDNILCYKDNEELKPAVIQIRPSDANSAHPGDDLLLTFNITNESDKTKKNIINKNITLQDKDYIVVYDKKMLWRANLYINLAEENLSMLDWNNAHPWNAPATSTSITGTWADQENDDSYIPEWKLEKWGCNEWNRTFNVSTTSSSVKKLSDLSVGNGGQVIEFSDYTPLRTLGTQNNYIMDAIAYSYPEHPKEPSEGFAGSMDSPFDFYWKLIQQKNELGKKYNSSGGEKDPNKPNDSWDTTKAPNDKWGKYDKGNSVQNFIPSLGLFYGFDSDLHEANLPNRESNDWNWQYTFEAGTDCVGFAQRSASYNDNRVYTWICLPKGIMEVDDDKYRSSVLNKYGENNCYRNHVRAKGNSKNAWDIFNVNSKAELTEDNLSELKKIVPGDIFSEYGCIKAQQETSTSNGPKHIAIIASVPYNIDSYTDSNELMKNIYLIEATFTNKIQSVIKVQNLYDYYKKKNQSDKYFYNKKVKFTKEGYNINCESFAVRRLFWKETN